MKAWDFALAFNETLAGATFRPAEQLTPIYSSSVDICFHRYRRAINAGM